RGGAAGAQLRSWYRALAEVRRIRTSLASHLLSATEAVVEGRSAIVVRRSAAMDDTIIAVAIGRAPFEFALPMAPRGGWRLLLDAGDFGGRRGAVLDGNCLHLPAWGAVVLSS